MRSVVTAAVAVIAVAGLAAANPIDTRVDSVAGSPTIDGVISPDEYGPGNAYSFGGAGSGFGGTLGNGTLYMKSDATNLYLAFQPGANLNDNVVIMMSTRADGFVDADMNDTADGARRGVSNLSANTNDPYPAGFLANYGLVIGNFGIVLFETTAGSDPGHLNFLLFDGMFSGNDASLAREVAIPLAMLGLSGGDAVDFFAAYVSDSGYASNESIPAFQPLQDNGNPGFGDGEFGGTLGTPGYGNFNRFVIIPTPGALALLGLAGLAACRRRR